MIYFRAILHFMPKNTSKALTANEATHAMEEATPEIKPQYIELCLERGGQYEMQDPTRPADTVWRYEHYGLHVLCRKDCWPLPHYAAYWASQNIADVKHQVEIFERRLQINSKRAAATRRKTRVQKASRASIVKSTVSSHAT